MSLCYGSPALGKTCIGTSPGAEEVNDHSSAVPRVNNPSAATGGRRGPCLSSLIFLKGGKKKREKIAHLQVIARLLLEKTFETDRNDRYGITVGRKMRHKNFATMDTVAHKTVISGRFPCAQVLAFPPQVLFLPEGFPSKSAAVSCKPRSLLQTKFSLCGRELCRGGKRQSNTRVRARSNECKISSIAVTCPANHVLELEGKM